MNEDLNQDLQDPMGGSDPSANSGAGSEYDSPVLNDNPEDEYLEGDEDQDLEGQDDDLDEPESDGDEPEGDGGTRKPPKSVPYKAMQKSRLQLKAEREEKEYWKQQAMAQQAAGQNQQPSQSQPFVYKTPEQIKQEQEAQAYRDRIKQLGFTPTEEAQAEKKALEDKIASIEKKLADDEMNRAVEKTKENLNRQANELSKKYDGTHGLKFEYQKFVAQAQKNPNVMRLLKAGFPMEDAFIILNKQAYATYATSTKTQPEPPVRSQADKGGSVDTSKMSAAELKEYLSNRKK